MPKGPVPEGIQGRLVERLRAIPDGQISAAAARADIALTAILRLRRGDATDIRLSTLERLARGLQVPVASLITDPDAGDEPAAAAPRGVDPRLVQRLVKKTRGFVADVEKFLAEVPTDEPAPSRARRDRVRRGASGKP